MEFKEEPYGTGDMSLKDKVAFLMESQGKQKGNGKKEKKFKLPFRGRLNKSKLAGGFVTIIEVGENNAVDFKREPIVDSTIKLNETYHYVEDEDMLSYRGKPMLIVPKKSKVPFNPNRTENETFSQKHIMSRMMNETLDSKKKIGALGMSIGAIILLGVVVYAFVAG